MRMRMLHHAVHVLPWWLQRDGGDGDYGAGWAASRADPGGAGSSGEISSKREAKRLAFYVFWNVLGEHCDRRFLVPRDFEPFFDMPEQVSRVAGSQLAAIG